MKVINESNLRVAIKESTKCNLNFNCWGATKFCLNKETKLKWLSQKDMEYFLKNSTIPIDKISRKGDIVAMYDDFGLNHTAIYIGNNLYYHKVGGTEGYIDTYEDVLDTYEYSYVRYSRININ